MKTAVFYGPDSPAPLVIEEVDLPRVGPTQVLIKVSACGVCSREGAAHRGRRTVDTPVIFGHEISGIVEEIGSLVRDFKPGDRVTTKQYSSCGRCLACRSGEDVRCTDPPQPDINGGGFAEYVAIEDQCCAMVPPGVDLAGASILACVAGIPWRALTMAQVQEGKSLW